MIIAALMLMAPALPIAADTQPVEQEIVVIGQKLKNWRGRIKTKKGQDVCKTTRSSGDVEIDQIGCNALIVCWPQFKAHLLAAGESKRPKEERRELVTLFERQMGSCAAAEYQTAIAALADRRAGLSQ